MKVLVVSPHYNTFIRDQVNALSDYLDEITVLVHHNLLSEFAGYLPFPYFRHVEKFSKKNLIDVKGISENIHVHVISTVYLKPDGSNLTLGEKLAKKYGKFIERNQIGFDLVHAHFTWPSGYAGVKSAREFGVPVVVTAHGFDVYDLPFRGKTWFEKVKFTLTNADHVITVSKSNFEILTKKLGVPPERVSVIPNGFNSSLFSPMDKFEARRVLNLPEDKKILLNVANLVPIKGHEFLIRAFSKVVKERKDVLLIIVGDGPERKKLERLIVELGLGNCVKLVGSKPHDEIPLWMNAADLFVLPSLSEGNPTVMFEALGVGLPFVGTAVGGVPEIITSEDYGLLCPPADPECLAEKILKALEKEWDKEKIRKYAEQFTWEKIANQTLEIYRSITKQ